jgi:S-DNA-T family DNA segregation ATPase FtsK/SpoIIIE
MTYSLNTLQSSSAAEGQPVRVRAMRFAHEITLIAGFAALLFWLLAMLSFTPSDAAWSTSGTGGEVKNWGGRIGAWLADGSYFLAGYSVWWCLAAGLRAWLSSLASWLRGGDTAPAAEQPPRGPLQPQPPGVLVRPGPSAVRQRGARMVPPVPSRIASSGLWRRRAGLPGRPRQRALDGLHRFGAGGHRRRRDRLRARVPFFVEPDRRAHRRACLLAVRVAPRKARNGRRHRHGQAGRARARRRRGARTRTRAAAKKARAGKEAAFGEPAPMEPSFDAEDEEEIHIDPPPKRRPASPPVQIEPAMTEVPRSDRVVKERQKPLFKELPDSKLPQVDLLDAAQVRQETVSSDTLEMTSRMIEKKLKDFGVEVRVVLASPGPVITRYEIEPATGVKGSQILGLAKDLARSLSLVSIRVVETIPGKNYMALELPNAKRQSIKLSEILGSQIYNEGKSMLTMGLGKDIIGNPVVADLAKMPHVLVAGTTGSGKSVGINAMILSLLYKAEARDVRLLMIDPKMLEMSVYEGIPHLLAPVVTDMRQAAHGLNWCVAEMERRYKLMSKLGVRNLAGYNTKIDEAKAREEFIYNPFSLTPDDPEPLKREPHIVVVIDELADLMMVVGKKIEELIARLAQKARAAGIHLILATQRPERRRDHRPDQGQHPDPHRLPGVQQDRQPHHPRPDGRRGAAGHGRHALHAQRHGPADPRARRLRERRGSAPRGGLPEEPGRARLHRRRARRRHGRRRR